MTFISAVDGLALETGFGRNGGGMKARLDMARATG
jgi:hypothetical protein